MQIILKRKITEHISGHCLQMSLFSCISISIFYSSTEVTSNSQLLVLIFAICAIIKEVEPLTSNLLSNSMIQELCLYLFPTDCSQSEGEDHISFTFHLQQAASYTRVFHTCVWNEYMKEETKSQGGEFVPVNVLHILRVINSSSGPFEKQRGDNPGIKSEDPVQIWVFILTVCLISVKLFNLSVKGVK